MKILLIFNIIGISLLGNSENTIELAVKNNTSLIAPGIGAENILLNQNASDLLAVKGYPDKVSELAEKRELFRDVFKIGSPVEIFFNKIFYYDFQKAVFFMNTNVITAIAGLKAQRVTIDSVGLDKGVEYFIFNYGNKNLRVLTKENESRDVIYLFSQGIAIVDDTGDDKIDMYVVFPGELK